MSPRPNAPSHRRQNWPLLALVWLGASALWMLPLACARGPSLAGAARGSNVVLTLIDAAAAPRLSTYGAERPTTPFLDQLAGEGTRFARVTAPAPYTLASVASLFTGEHPDVHQVIHAGDLLPAPIATLAERFAAAGYRTHGASSNAHVHERFGFARGFDRFTWFDPQVGIAPYHTVPEEMLLDVEARLREKDPRPLFLYAHFMPPHAPYDPPPEFLRWFANAEVDRQAGSIENLTPLTAGVRRAGPREAQAILDLYDGSLRYVDGVLARIGALLEREELLERTLWVVLSDHGEAFGEHGVWQHSRLVVEPMVHVPLVLRAPRGFAGGKLAARTIQEPVSLVDLTPTLWELCGLEGAKSRSAVSLVPLLAGEPLPERPPIVARTAGPGPYTAVREGQWKAIYHASSRRWQLFDLAADPSEQVDLARERPEALAPLQGELQRWWERWRPYSSGARERVRLSAEERRRMAALGYFDTDTDADDDADSQPSTGQPDAEAGREADQSGESNRPPR